MTAGAGKASAHDGSASCLTIGGGIPERSRTSTGPGLGRLPLPVGLRGRASCRGRESNPHWPGPLPGASACWATAARCPRMELNHHCPGPEPSASASWATGASDCSGAERNRTSKPKRRVYSPLGSPPTQPPRELRSIGAVDAPEFRRDPSSAGEVAGDTSAGRSRSAPYASSATMSTRCCPILAVVEAPAKARPRATTRLREPR